MTAPLRYPRSQFLKPFAAIRMAPSSGGAARTCLHCGAFRYRRGEGGAMKPARASSEDLKALLARWVAHKQNGNLAFSRAIFRS